MMDSGDLAVVVVRRPKMSWAEEGSNESWVRFYMFIPQTVHGDSLQVFYCTPYSFTGWLESKIATICCKSIV